jgi:membrane-associated phospholipid phosphatase
LIFADEARAAPPAKPAPTTRKAPPARQPSIETAKKVRWDPRWQRFELANYLSSAGLLAVSIGALAIPPDEERWTETNSFDNSVRNALRLNGRDYQFIARDASDILLAASLNQLLVDSLVVTWWGHDNGDVAWQMALMSVEALAYNTAVNSLVSGLTSRQRPYAYPIEGTPGADRCVGDANERLEDCFGNKRYRSFYSGHTSVTFAVAGLTCMHHAHLPLYGGGAGDVIACVTGFALAGGTGVLRIVSDQHWMSDVLVGAAIGTFNGLAIPWLLHYRTRDLPKKPKAGEIDLRVLPGPMGATMMGVF